MNIHKSLKFGVNRLQPRWSAYDFPIFSPKKAPSHHWFLWDHPIPPSRGAFMMRPPSVTDVEAAQSHLVLLKSKMRQRRQQADNRIGVLVGSKKKYGYGSIPINTIFSGLFTSIYQLFWCELQGYYWFWHTAILEKPWEKLENLGRFENCWRILMWKLALNHIWIILLSRSGVLAGPRGALIKVFIKHNLLERLDTSKKVLASCEGLDATNNWTYSWIELNTAGYEQ